MIRVLSILVLSLLFLLLSAKLCAEHNKVHPQSDIDTPSLGPIQLAEKYTDTIDVKDYFVSEKLDGIRARWTGTQLYTRKGNEIHAPPWFTKYWPVTPMDGELWTKRDDFAEIASIVLSHTPDERWHGVKMMLFDLPITNVPFATRLKTMQVLVANTKNPNLAVIEQTELPSPQALTKHLEEITALGGEGLMLHRKSALYQDGRSHDIVKAKLHEDAEAKVIAVLPGKGQFSNVMGSLLVETPAGLQFKIGSGFTLAERSNPPPVGSWITYKYYGLTKQGIPRFASYLRVRPVQDGPK